MKCQECGSEVDGPLITISDEDGRWMDVCTNCESRMSEGDDPLRCDHCGSDEYLNDVFEHGVDVLCDDCFQHYSGDEV